MGTKANLVSIPTLVESPFIIVHIGNFSFGSYTAEKFGKGIKVSYPNFVEGMEVTKVNGTVNTYVLRLTYQVSINDDPNFIDKVISSAANDRRLILEYGDWNSPSYIYKQEKCIITSVTSSLNMNNSCIKYTIKCTSDAVGLASKGFNFPAREDKPSDVLKEMLRSPKYGLREVFAGMSSASIDALIASNDRKVSLLPQTNVTPLEYMRYLVDSMQNHARDKNSVVGNTGYVMTIHDDLSSNYSGSYFKVVEVGANTKTLSMGTTYEIDVNFPSDNFVTQFSLNNDQSWSILYEFADKLEQENYVYNYDDAGNLVSTYAPSLARSPNGALSVAKSNWWTRVTQFPIQATLTIKGLTRPSILMSYVKVNVWFAGGKKHNSSGLYVITKQIDTLDASGYKTTLTLLRVGGDS